MRKWAMRWLPLIVILNIFIRFPSLAQEADAYRFQPPPPPPLADEPDFDELDDETFEADEDGFHPPPPPPIMPSAGSPAGRPNPAPAPPPPPDYRTSNEAYISSPGKFRFRIVEGEFWKKGKKRTRGRQMLGRSTN